MNVDIDDINIEQLRNDLMDYFGSAMINLPAVMMELNKVENANDEEIIRIALNNGFDLGKYVNQKNLTKK